MLTIYLTSVVESGAGGNAEMLDTWIARIAEKDAQALADLYHSTSASVYAFALSILKNTHDAEDVLQDCYVNLFTAAPSYRSTGKPLAWILTIARNLCLRKFRDRGKTEDVPAEDWERYLDAQEKISPEDKLVLWNCMSLLSNTERQIVILHAVHGFKHREIAEIIKTPLPTVLSKYNRALKKLKKALKGEDL